MNKLMSTFCVIVLGMSAAFSQVYEYADKQGHTHRVLKTDHYLVETIYEKDPAKFIATRGGFLEEEEGTMNIILEFNSAFEKDGKTELLITNTRNWKEISKGDEKLEANWLFATRMRNGQMSHRRGEESSRKTIKILLSGCFQWIAYDTNGMKFYGSGGGTYTASEGEYVETIQYFSKDSKRVGAILAFEYELEGADWHHKGLSSKGEPIHEVWTLREKKAQ